MYQCDYQTFKDKECQTNTLLPIKCCSIIASFESSNNSQNV